MEYILQVQQHFSTVPIKQLEKLGLWFHSTTIRWGSRTSEYAMLENWLLRGFSTTCEHFYRGLQYSVRISWGLNWRKCQWKVNIFFDSMEQFFHAIVFQMNSFVQLCDAISPLHHFHFVIDDYFGFICQQVEKCFMRIETDRLPAIFVPDILNTSIFSKSNSNIVFLCAAYLYWLTIIHKCLDWYRK